MNGGTRIVKKPGPITRLVNRVGGPLHAKGLLIWCAVLVTGVLCIWQQVYATRLASEIDELQHRREYLRTEIGFLRMECVSLSSRERIQEYAEERLGMRHPKPGEIIRLEDATISRTIRPEDLAAGTDDAQING